MNWNQDPQTALAAKTYPLPLHCDEPMVQFPGYNFNPESWNRRTMARCWPCGSLRSSPEQIIQLFREDHYLEALAMTGLWGGMVRASSSIYRDYALDSIEHSLRQCARSIQETNQADAAWLTLTGHEPGQLRWSAVMTSKALHFLCRALGNETRPPVPRDNAVILKSVWPRWTAQIPMAQRPQDWQGNSFDAYRRYMTAILVWPKLRGWTTSQMEATIFRVYGTAI